MATIYELLKKYEIYRGNRYTGEVGVEIETETSGGYEYPKLKYWKCDRDRSLRNFGVEYILRSPMTLVELENAFKEFEPLPKEYKFHDTPVSAGVHVHLNMLNETFLTLANLLTTYSITENLLIKYSGPDRLSNLFCLPMCDAEGVVQNNMELIKNIGRNYYARIGQNEDSVKYGALNCAPLTKLGSVEFRSFRGTTNVNEIRKWVHLLMDMKNFSKQKGLVPTHIIDMYRDLPINEFLANIFGEYHTELLYDNAKDLIFGKVKQKVGPPQEYRNLVYGAELATSVKTWEGFGIPKVKKVYTEKVKSDLDGISQSIFRVPFDDLDYSHRLVVDDRYHRANSNVHIVDGVRDE